MRLIFGSPEANQIALALNRLPANVDDKLKTYLITGAVTVLSPDFDIAHDAYIEINEIGRGIDEADALDDTLKEIDIQRYDEWNGRIEQIED